MSDEDKLQRRREQTQLSRSTKRVKALLDQEARDIAMAALAKTDAHEILCDERWKAHDNSMARIEKTMDAVEIAINDKIGKLPASVISVLFGVVGFLAAKVIS